MDFLLNEKSLNGQFEDAEAFYRTLPDMLGCLSVLKKLGFPLQKRTSFYESQITKSLSVYDLANRNERVEPEHRDEVRALKRMLVTLSWQEPFWDMDLDGIRQNLLGHYYFGEEDVSGTSLAEAAERDGVLISFLHDDFRNCRVAITSEDKIWNVFSVADKVYLADILYDKRQINVAEYLRMRYSKGKLNFEQMDERLGVEILEMDELAKALEAFERFESLGWEQIPSDTYFYYKRYAPSDRDDWFRHTEYSERSIYKFRCGMHSQVRCFGYRENDMFYVLRMERDHKVSDKG